ncbi:hypothetical protein IWW49_001078 [Coemansia sp. RSA 1797]|nr:hypothetical protein IWW49_001078 [Coemansia sp. RSA 1797]
MRTKVAVGKSSQRRDTSLANMGLGKQECLRDMEIQAREIRESSNWIRQIVQKSHARNHSEDSTHSGSLDVPYTNDCETCMVAQTEDLADTGDGPSYELDSVPLIHRFGIHASGSLAESNCSTEGRLDLQQRSPTSKLKLCMFVLAHAGMIGYLCALWQLLANQTNEPFWHPILMSVSLVLATESVLLMQFAPWPAPTHKPTHVFHYIAHIVSFLLQIVGIVHYAKQPSSVQRSKQSAHKVTGGLAALLFGIQVLFGVYVTWIAPKVGGQKYGKGLYKYHRAVGYIVLVVQWAGTWFGVHEKWVQSERAPNECTWLLVFSALVVGVLVPIDMSKFGVQPA